MVLDKVTLPLTRGIALRDRLMRDNVACSLLVTARALNGPPPGACELDLDLDLDFVRLVWRCFGYPFVGVERRTIRFFLERTGTYSAVSGFDF